MNTAGVNKGKEVPKDLRIAYTNITSKVSMEEESGVTSSNVTNYCEECNLTINGKDLQLGMS